MRSYRASVGKFSSTPLSLLEVLTQMAKLEREVLAAAAEKGAVWLQRKGKGKILRSRNLREILSPEDVVYFYYDRRILELPSLKHADCIYEDRHYGVWVKPAGVLPQGTQAGDHTSLLRYVEALKKKQLYLIHRLDRETEGLMLIGYSSEAAAKLTRLFTTHQIKKTYQALVLGEMQPGARDTIRQPLDGKEAITHFQCLAVKPGSSLLEVELETGRLHQIRRHMHQIGHPLIGDPRYGSGNKNREGLQLKGVRLEFQDPWSGSLRCFELPGRITI
jgi:tRNA pseudouridine32 synthase / 23S rRNA pseudouridine746 synthase